MISALSSRIVKQVQLADLLSFPEYNSPFLHSTGIEWSPGTAKVFMHVIKVTDRELFEIYQNESSNMSIRYLTLDNKYDEFLKVIRKLFDTIKTFVSLADALRRSEY